MLRDPEFVDNKVTERYGEHPNNGPVELSSGYFTDRFTLGNLSGSFQALRRDLVDPGEDQHSRETDYHQNHNQLIRPNREVKHMEHHMQWIQN